MVICDRGYLKHQKGWRKKVAYKADGKVIQIESDVTAPVETVSTKAEYAARTIRNKVMIRMNDYIKKIPVTEVKKSSLEIKIERLKISDIENFIEKLKVDRSVSKVNQFFNGGTTQAKKVFKRFLKHKLANYIKNRNQPHTDDISHMSVYLHFGQISPVYLVYLISREKGYEEDVKAYIEELVVRRELAINFVNFTPGYDSYGCLPQWARKSLEKHEEDKRAALYSLEELEQALTNDKYWNACMEAMKYTGFMHNYMRMYWEKKIIEWTLTAEDAYHTILHLNNKYFLDGRDCTSYANVC